MSALESNLWPLLGQVVLHSLWQGALVALLAAGFLRALRERDPRERYAVGGMALLLVATMPVVTFLWLQANTHVHVAAAAPLAAVSMTAAPAAAPSPGALTWVAWAWLLGALVQQLRLIVGYGRMSGLKRRGARVAPARYQSLVEELAEAMGLVRRVRLVISERVHVPSLVGWIEPVVLVPVGALNQLSTAEVRAVLAHELAHLKRLDPLLNGLQSVLETVFFYHPAVWWISRRVREEREYCCDDLAAAVCGDGVTLARALANLETSRPLPDALVLSSQGGSLMQRVRRLVTPGTRRGGRASMLVPALFLASSMALTAGSASAWSAGHDDECEACKARLERRAARKAAKHAEENHWVALDVPLDQPVDRWVTATPKGRYLLEWSQEAPEPARERVLEWTYEAPPKVDFTEPEQPEIRWHVEPTSVGFDTPLEYVEFDDVTGACEVAEVEPTKSVGRYLFQGAGEEGQSVWITYFEGDVENVFFNEPQIVDITEECEVDLVELGFDAAGSTDEGAVISWDTRVEAPEPVEAVKDELEGYYFDDKQYFVSRVRPVVTRTLEVPGRQLWLSISKAPREKASESAESDFFVSRGSFDLTEIDVEQDFFVGSAAEVEVQDFFVGSEAEVEVQDFFVTTTVELEEAEESVDLEVSEGAPTGDFQIIYTGRHVPGSRETQLFAPPAKGVERIQLTVPTPSGQVEVAPQRWIDTTIEERAPEPAPQGDADLRRQIQELRKQLERLERELDGKDNGAVSTLSRQHLWREAAVRDLTQDVEAQAAAPTVKGYYKLESGK